MTVQVCRCCGEAIPPEYPHVEILVSMFRPRPNAHAPGPAAAVGCDACAPGIQAGVLHVATLWRPGQPCDHIQAGLFG